MQEPLRPRCAAPLRNSNALNHGLYSASPHRFFSAFLTSINLKSAAATPVRILNSFICSSVCAGKNNYIQNPLTFSSIFYSLIFGLHHLFRVCSTKEFAEGALQGYSISAIYNRVPRRDQQSSINPFDTIRLDKSISH